MRYFAGWSLEVPLTAHEVAAILHLLGIEPIESNGEQAPKLAPS